MENKMHKYSLMQVKENLPNILDTIETKKKLADAELWLYRCLVQQCVWETTHPDADYGIWTTKEFMQETWQNYKRYLEEAEYLESLVRQLQNNSATLDA